MKINLDIDATPAELRAFFGLPDLEPLQQDILERVRKNMMAGAEGFDPNTLMKAFLPLQVQSMEAMQHLFWDAFKSGMGERTSEPRGEGARDTEAQRRTP
jgi:hypothetical protein